MLPSLLTVLAESPAACRARSAIVWPLLPAAEETHSRHTTHTFALRVAISLVTGAHPRANRPTEQATPGAITEVVVPEMLTDQFQGPYERCKKVSVETQVGHVSIKGNKNQDRLLHVTEHTASNCRFKGS
jgi:hypothetical protein